MRCHGDSPDCSSQALGEAAGQRIQHTAFLNVIKSRAHGALNHGGPATICWGWQPANHHAGGRGHLQSWQMGVAGEQAGPAPASWPTFSDPSPKVKEVGPEKGHPGVTGKGNSSKHLALAALKAQSLVTLKMRPQLLG